MKNIKQLKNQKENWEKEFDENFESEIKGLGEIWESHKIKSFIRRLLLKQKTGNRAEKKYFKKFKK